MYRRVLIGLVVGTAALGAQPQAQAVPPDPCSVLPTGTTFVVTASQPPYVTWTHDATVPASSTDPTMVPARVDGWYLRLDTQTRVDIGKLTWTPCPAGNANAGKLGFVYRWPSPVAGGKHTITVSGWNFVLDASGVPTTTRQEGVATSIPFTAVDPIHTTPPLQPGNGAVRSGV